MSNKCVWKDGKFLIACCEKISMTNRGPDILLDNGDWEIFKTMSFCPFCGADIRKPEPEVIIRKSGGTYSVRWENIDYLVLEPYSQYFDPDGDNDYSRLLYDDVIKPISEIEITDEIAKLRPMVILENKEPYHMDGDEDPLFKLYGVSHNEPLIHEDGLRPFFAQDCSHIRLATVEDITG